MSDTATFPFVQDTGLDLADMIVRGGVSVEKLVELSDTGDGGGVSVESKKDGYYKDSLYQSDGSAPLTNPKYERFLDMYIGTGRMEVAYRACVSGNCSKESATQQASRLLKRVEVSARLRFLMMAKKKQVEQPAADGVRMTKATKLAELERIIRTGTPSDRVRAIQEHNRLMAAGQAGAANVPDPCFLADFMRRAAKENKAPVDLAKELKTGDNEDLGEVPLVPDEPDDVVPNEDDLPTNDGGVNVA
jgi:hypothetical protein